MPSVLNKKVSAKKGSSLTPSSTFAATALGLQSGRGLIQTRQDRHQPRQQIPCSPGADYAREEVELKDGPKRAAAIADEFTQSAS